MERNLPFTISANETFIEKLGEWVGDVFYEILPEFGFEIRDEQIFMAYQLERAFKEKKVIFAEAGVGTGKTIVYLLYAICYARYTNRPAIIACADDILIEQLVKKEGDIAKLEKALQLNIDVRLAKSRSDYLCIQKLHHYLFDDEAYSKVNEELPPFVFDEGSMQTFTYYGDRKDYPYLSDEQWEKIGWDPLYDCLACTYRHRCGQSLHREYYRKATDLIVCSHDFFMEHIWTRDSRKRNGQLPLLPESCCVIFDEGHLLEYACQKALTYQLSENTLEQLLTRLMENDVREETLHIIEDILMENQIFFDELQNVSSESHFVEKREIKKTIPILEKAKRLLNFIIQLQDELVFEGELYQINEYDLRIVEEYLDQMEYSLNLFLQNFKGIIWYEETKEERKLVIMPRLVKEVMREEVFKDKKPYIFSSATLSENNSFSYIANSLGIDNYLSFTVDSPFNYEHNVSIHLPTFTKNHLGNKQKYVFDALLKSNGRALVLFTSKEDMKNFKSFISKKTSFPVYMEGEQEISTIVSYFQNEEESVLLSTNLWEGLDVPGRSLENVIIFDLPFPPNDPVFSAKREDANAPYEEIDLPYMLLRLRQGIGRLIRTKKDEGNLHILLHDELDEQTWNKILQVLPTEGKVFTVENN